MRFINTLGRTPGIIRESFTIKVRNKNIRGQQSLTVFKQHSSIYFQLYKSSQLKITDNSVP